MQADNVSAETKSARHEEFKGKETNMTTELKNVLFGELSSTEKINSLGSATLNLELFWNKKKFVEDASISGKF